jgi:predicted nucleic acid-binding protein
VSDLQFDTCILIDALRGQPKAQAVLRRAKRRWISRMTWIEVLAGADDETRDDIEAFLERFTIIEINADVARRAAHIRSQRRLKLPDAVIWASAQAAGHDLVTRNSKDFPKGTPGVRIPYEPG